MRTEEIFEVIKGKNMKTEEIFEVIKGKIFPKLIADTNLQIQEAQRITHVKHKTNKLKQNKTKTSHKNYT